MSPSPLSNHEWPQTQVHREYDPAGARERLRRDAERRVPNKPIIYDPTRPRVLERRQAEVMPYWIEAILLALVTIMFIAIFVVAALSDRG